MVNDFDERGIGLMKDFSKGMTTKNKPQTQYLLQEIEDHRRRFRNADKSKVSRGLATTES